MFAVPVTLPAASVLMFNVPLNPLASMCHCPCGAAMCPPVRDVTGLTLEGRAPTRVRLGVPHHRSYQARCSEPETAKPDRRGEMRPSIRPFRVVERNDDL